MNLTDSAKDEVKYLFEKFKPDNETGYTQEESKNIVTNSLKNILTADQRAKFVELIQAK